MPAKRQTAGPSGSSTTSNQKRIRFESPTPGSTARASTSLEPEDDLLEEDLPENAQKDKARSRKQLQDQDGYGSDSSNDEEGVVPSRRPGAKADDDDDVDMFADEEPAEKPQDKGKGKGKDKEFMDLKDFEGQEFGETDEGYDSDTERTRRKEGLDGDFGIEVIPFNMKNEMDEGRFTADGETYVTNDKDPNEKHDVWLTNLDAEEIAKARKAHEEREEIERKREIEEDNVIANKEKQDELMRVAVGLMERGETVLEALQRLGKEVEDKRKKEEGGKKKSWAERQKERKAQAAAEAEQANDSYHTQNPFTNLSNIVAALTNIGQLDVYSLPRESLQRMLPAPASNGQSASIAPPRDVRQFEYRFSMAYVKALPEAQRPVEREVFGPFPVAQLRQWRGTGFFGGPDCANVELRKAGGGGAWASWADTVEST